MLIDTSLIVQLLRDTTGKAARNWRELTAGRETALSRLTQLEILQGARDSKEWDELEDYLDGQDFLEMGDGSWRDAARIFFELRRKGLTVRSVIDCLNAQLAIDHKATLLHVDRDYEAIHRIRPSLRQRRIDLLA